VAVQIDEAGRNNKIRGVKKFSTLGALGELACRSDRGDAISIEQNVTR
jgi:hypothetical protein